MVLKRPLLFLSLPSLALVLGLVWYRRKKSVHCDTGGGNIINNKQKTTTTIINNKNSNIQANDEIIENNFKTLKHSNSLPITNKNNTNLTELIDTKLGKSAPIDIIPKLRSPPFKKNNDNSSDHINNDITNNKDIDYKTLKSIEESEDFDSISPIDLPDSVERKKFIFQERIIKQEEEPIIIKASMTAKVSPKNSFIENKYTEECVEEIESSRDSANHSPIERNILSEKDEDSVNNDDEDIHDEDEEDDDNDNRHLQQISSPPLSLCSLHSNDSGKGSSPPHSEATPTVIYEFLLPQNLVGHIIGRKGSYVNQIKSKTGANVIVRKHVQSNKMKVCSIDGTQPDVDAALLMIRNKLPEKRYPQLTLERVFYTTTQTVIPLETIDSGCLRLNLIEGINNDVIISSIINGGHVFFQQPLHPSYPSLNILQTCMSHSYTLNESPTLPDITDDAICVAPIDGSWYRVQIVAHNPETLSSLCKYLDFGGYCSVLSTELRQIRTDFMTVPFQSIECLLSNIKPAGGEWAPEAIEVLGQLTQGIILQAQVAGYSSDGLPEVYLYASLGPDNVIDVNQELVARGLAEWTEDSLPIA